MLAFVAAATAQVAVDTLVANIVDEPFERGTRFGDQRLRLAGAVFRMQRRIIRLDFAADLSAVARAAAPTDLRRIDDQRFTPGGSRHQRAMQAGIARTDDEYVGLRRR